ncbi:hypothetical protein STEG23_000599, partial [Scotinomys teguina]
MDPTFTTLLIHSTLVRYPMASSPPVRIQLQQKEEKRSYERQITTPQDYYALYVSIREDRILSSESSFAIRS